MFTEKNGNIEKERFDYEPATQTGKGMKQADRHYKKLYSC